MVCCMNLHIEDINPVLEEFEGWLDRTIKPGGNYFARPLSDCRGHDCPARLYQGPIPVGAAYEAAKGRIGKESRSDKLNISLARHAEDCGRLIIASVTRTTEVAKKLGKGLVRVQFRDIKLNLGRASGGSHNDLPIHISEASETSTKMWLPDGSTDTMAQVATNSRFPNDPAEVDVLLRKMQDEITWGLQGSNHIV